VICNSHAGETAKRLGVPLLRAGFPQYDLIGGYQKLWVGYRGTRQALFDLANLIVEHGHHDVPTYRSIYASRPESLSDGTTSQPTRPPNIVGQVSGCPSPSPACGGGELQASLRDVHRNAAHATPETRPLH
jgi:hypothetical protein